MYMIAEVCFGVPMVDSQIAEHFPKLHQAIIDTDDGLMEEMIDNDYLANFYHGGSNEEPRILGVAYESFDECESHWEVTDLIAKFMVPEEVIDQCKQKIEGLAEFLDRGGFPEAADEIRAVVPRPFVLITSS